MNNSVLGELAFFAASAAAGFFCAFLYDILRISRRLVRVSDLAVNLEDILFMGTAAVVLFYASYLLNSGEMRWHSFIGGAAGVALYITAVGNRVLDLSCVIIKFSVKAGTFLLKILLYPIGFVFGIMRKPIVFVAWYSGRGIKRVKGTAGIYMTKMKINLKSISKMLKKR